MQAAAFAHWVSKTPATCRSLSPPRPSDSRNRQMPPGLSPTEAVATRRQPSGLHRGSMAEWTGWCPRSSKSRARRDLATLHLLRRSRRRCGPRPAPHARPTWPMATARQERVREQPRGRLDPGVVRTKWTSNQPRNSYWTCLTRMPGALISPSTVGVCSPILAMFLIRLSGPSASPAFVSQ